MTWQVPSAPVAGGSLLLGFAVAQATGVRWLAGPVLLAGAAACVVLWRRAGGTPLAAGLLAAYAAAFAGSHLLAPAVGAWLSVLLVAASISALAAVLADRRLLRPAAGTGRPMAPASPGRQGRLGDGSG
jgi:hypothetical protein